MHGGNTIPFKWSLWHSSQFPLAPELRKVHVLQNHFPPQDWNGWIGCVPCEEKQCMTIKGKKLSVYYHKRQETTRRAAPWMASHRARGQLCLVVGVGWHTGSCVCGRQPGSRLIPECGGATASLPALYTHGHWHGSFHWLPLLLLSISHSESTSWAVT